MRSLILLAFYFVTNATSLWAEDSVGASVTESVPALLGVADESSAGEENRVVPVFAPDAPALPHPIPLEADSLLDPEPPPAVATSRAYPVLSRQAFENDYGGYLLGSNVEVYLDDAGNYFRYAEDALPPASDPNDFQTDLQENVLSLNQLKNRKLLTTLFGRNSYEDNANGLRAGVQLRPGIFYDTGYISPDKATFNPANIALDGSAGAHQRGQFSFQDITGALKSTPLRFHSDYQFANFLGRDDSFGQLYVDTLYNNGNDYQVRSAFARVASRQELAVGQAESAFGDIGAAPKVISTGALPVGSIGLANGTSVFQGVIQMRYTFNFDAHWAATISLEDQDRFNNSLAPPAGATLLNRPAIATRLRYRGANLLTSYQLGALIRNTTIDDPTFQNHTANCWGVSGIMRHANTSGDNVFFAGVAGGHGIGDYLYGGTRAVFIPNNSSIQALKNIGCYAAYQRVWSWKTVHDSSRKPLISSNCGLGAVTGDAPLATDNKRLYQAWSNLLYNPTDFTSYGFEYQYGNHEIGSGVRGDDSRFMFVAQIGTPGATVKPNSTAMLRGRSEVSTQRPLASRRL